MCCIGGAQMILQKEKYEVSSSQESSSKREEDARKIT
jgi:hypothetical protein